MVQEAATAGSDPALEKEKEMTIVDEDAAEKVEKDVVEEEGSGMSDLDGRRWYNQGQVYVTWEEFRETPMGRDFLNGPEPFDAEEDARKKFKTLPTEELHRKAGGHWDLQVMENLAKPWGQMNTLEKVEEVVVSFIKFCAIWAVLYLFIISLGIMGDAFKILGGRSSGRTFRESELLSNPVAGLAIGILATVLMQSSSTTTSIVISMAGADLVTIKNAAYLIMGANIGTSVTNTIVSLAHVNSVAEYRRAFTGAVFHDMFNWLTVFIFLPLEASSAFLVEMAAAAVDSLGIERDQEKRGKVDFIKKITSPAAGRVSSSDSDLIKAIAGAETEEEVKELEKGTIIKQKSGHVLRDAAISDDEAGVLLLFVSLTMLAVCLLLLVKLLQSVLKGRVAVWTRYLLNIEFQHPILRVCGGLDNYILLFFGTGVTILVQSSSVFTSTITPLVAMGLIHIEKAVPLTHGANIGTTVTGVLSALSGSNVYKGMRVALEHVFFNCLGTCVWFVVWPLRPVPLNMAKFMGETAANLRWFPLAYILLGFLLFPLLIIGLSIPGWEVLAGVMIPVAVALIVLLSFVLLRRNRADLLPRSMPILRSETAPCGWRYPNFMQLWGGDIDQDAVDLAEMKEKEKIAAAKLRSLREWAYSPAAWGLAIMAFVGAVLCVPTTQWRRIRYASETPGRKEVGFGLWEVCSYGYEKDMIQQPAPVACTYNDLIQDCAAELIATCEADATWATEYDADSEVVALAYTRAFERCSMQGCRAHAWETECKKILECEGRAGHEQYCSSVLESYVFYHTVNQDANGVTHEYATETAEPEQLPLQNPLFDEAPEDEDAGVEVFSVAPDASVGAAAYHACTGFVHTVVPAQECAGTTGETQMVAKKVRMQYTFTNEAVSQTVVDDASQAVPLTECSSTAAGVTVEDMDILDSQAGAERYVGVSERDEVPRVSIWDASGPTPTTTEYVPEGTTGAGAGAVAVLPQMFGTQQLAGEARRVLKSVAVNTEKTMLVTCLSGPLGAVRLVRCAVLNITNVQTPVLVAQKVVLLQDVGETETVELVGASWLSDQKVLFVEQHTSASGEGKARLVQVDFAKGSNLNSSHNDLENTLAQEADKTTTVFAEKLFEAGVFPAPLKKVEDVPSEIRATGLSSVAIANEYSYVLTEAGRASADADGGEKLWVLQVSEVTGELDLDTKACNGTSANSDNLLFEGEEGNTCKSISDICPDGDLEGDLADIAGLVVSGTLFLGLGTVMIMMFSLWGHNPIIGKFLYASAVTLTLSWILLLAAWAHMFTLQTNTYGCYFADEALRGGWVKTTGELQYLTMQSYSWAFCIYAWGVLTISLIVVWSHVINLIISPPAAPVAEEEEAQNHA